MQCNLIQKGKRMSKAMALPIVRAAQVYADDQYQGGWAGHDAEEREIVIKAMRKAILAFLDEGDEEITEQMGRRGENPSRVIAALRSLAEGNP